MTDPHRYETTRFQFFRPRCQQTKFVSPPESRATAFKAALANGNPQLIGIEVVEHFGHGSSRIGLCERLTLRDSQGLCPVEALNAWRDAAGVAMGPVFRSIRKGFSEARKYSYGDNWVVEFL